MPLNHENLLERILVARPDADVEVVRQMAPALAPLPRNEIEARLAKARRRLEKSQASS
jgi:hypothetical protein